MTFPNFGRLITAMATPFSADGQVDIEEACRLANHLVETKTQTLVIAGTTGESPTLSFEEEHTLFKAILATVKGKAFVLAGTGSNSTATAIRETQRAEALGVDGTLQVVPYYNRPSQEGLYQHFKAIAAQTRLPIMLYNIPGRTGRNLEPETVSRLVEISNIVSIKESAGNVEQVKKLRSLTPDAFTIYSGDDALTLAFMEQGAYGVVSVAGHIAGTEISDMMEKFASGDKSGAYQIEDRLKALFDVLFINSNPSPVKYALNLLGFKMGGLRLPLVELNDDEKRQVKQVLVEGGWIDG